LLLKHSPRTLLIDEGRLKTRDHLTGVENSRPIAMEREVEVSLSESLGVSQSLLHAVGAHAVTHCSQKLISN